jgi:hypothetical protein
MSTLDPLSAPQHERPAAPAGPGTDLLERTETEEKVEQGDHDRYAHYVRKNKIMESAMSGKPVIALCGKVWVPGRDPNKFPICPACKAIYDKMVGPEDKE